MSVPFKSFQTLVNDQAVATQAASTVPIDLNVGTAMLSMIEANAGMGMWLQFLFSAILSLARAQTSEGADLDSYYAQFYFYRLPAVASTGNVTFSRLITTGTVLIPAGSTKVKTTDFSLQFTVIADTTNPNWNASLNAYVMNPSIASTLAKVQCDTAGAVGNVAENVITFISTPVAGINSVNNLTAFSNGKNAESDPNFRARFVLYINSLSRAVLLAYQYVLSSIPQITRFNVIENLTYAGAVQKGYVYTVIDDGTGNPSSNLIAQALAAIQTMRGLAIQNDVFAPIPIIVNITVDLKINSSVTEATITGLVNEALAGYINTFPFNTVSPYTTILPYSKIYEIIYNASSYIINASNLLVNGAVNDLSGGANNAYVAGTITIGYV